MESLCPAWPVQIFMMAATHRVGSHIVFNLSTESVFETNVITTNDKSETLQ